METEPTENHMNRRTFLSYIFKTAAAIASVGTLTTGYSIFGEPHWIQTKHVSLVLPNFPAAFSGMKMVQFSDVHLGNYFKMSRFAELVTRLNQLKPDLLCFTGDLFDDHQGHPSEDVIPLLQQLEAPLGKLAVLGNHDYRLGRQRITDLLTRGGFTVLNNSQGIVEREGVKIRVAGVSDMIFGKPNLQEALRRGKELSFTLLLVHEPDFADIAANFPIDLQISGHSHGGQVRLPFLGGSLSAPEFGRKYIQGLYTVANSKLQVYTNRGIGTTLLPIRFMCRPEITVFTLKNV